MEFNPELTSSIEIDYVCGRPDINSLHYHKSQSVVCHDVYLARLKIFAHAVDGEQAFSLADFYIRDLLRYALRHSNIPYADFWSD